MPVPDMYTVSLAHGRTEPWNMVPWQNKYAHYTKKEEEVHKYVQL